MSERVYADAPAAPPPGTMSGKTSCLLAAVASCALGLGAIGAGWFLFQRRNAENLKSVQEMSAILDRARKAPGAAELGGLGCRASGVIRIEDLSAVAQHLENERARKKNEAAKTVDLGPREPVVFCALNDGVAPSCGETARAYATAARPNEPFVVTVRRAEKELCAERFDAAAAPLGSAESPNLPPLVPIR